MRQFSTIAVCCVCCLLNAQERAEKPLTPKEAAKTMQLPGGFNAKVFAAEPDIVQPIAMAIDARGRLWVVECLSYPYWKDIGVTEGKDRVVILEDTDGDGRHDKRTVFLDNGRNLSGIELGFGGVYLCSSPDLIFIPDQDGNDVPDGPAEILLSGFTLNAKHNVFNGLHWGPDGWLYGLHGITDTSKITNPNAPDDEPVKMNCGVWRYHPVNKRYETYCWGSTNPWGLDWNSVGQSFMTNCVIEHVFHVVQGAHFKRMSGDDLNPHVYTLMETCADHIHWAGGFWDTSIGGKHDDAGGGHAHCGAMIYQGDNWPKEYRGKLYTINIHGRRMNCDRLEESEDGYVATHDKDFMLSKDPFFRGVEMKYGPDGGVYLLDWNDTGECHDFVDIHVETGRVFKIEYGEAKYWTGDLAVMSNEGLVDLQRHENEWFSRMARRVLQERFAVARGSQDIPVLLRTSWNRETDPIHRLRLFWCMVACDVVDNQTLSKAASGTMHERIWTLRVLGHMSTKQVNLSKELEELKSDRRGLILQEKVSAGLFRADVADVFADVLSHDDPGNWKLKEQRHNDRLGSLIWYLLEPSIDERFVPRRHSFAALVDHPIALSALVSKLAAVGKPGIALEVAEIVRRSNRSASDVVVKTLAENLRGRDVQRPEEWASIKASCLTDAVSETSAIYELGLIFEDQEIRSKLLQVVGSDDASETRVAFDLLTRYPGAATASIIQAAMQSETLRESALNALSIVELPEVAELMVSKFHELSSGEQIALIDALVTRKSYAALLLDSIESKTLPKTVLTTLAMGQLKRIKDKALQNRLEQIYGVVGETDATRKKQINRLKKMLVSEAMGNADLQVGKKVFAQKCAACHQLFGEGGKIGPDLTGGQRQSVEYFLENVVAPNTLVPYVYKVKVIETVDGRVLSGVVESEDEKRLILQTPKEKIVISKQDVEEIKSTGVSLMPEGLLNDLTNQQIIDLVAYFQGQPSHQH